jgi:hypothetical protein
MKRTVLFISLLYSLPLFSQVITVEDFITLTNLSDKKLTSYIGKMSFVPVGRTMEDGTTISEYFYRNKKAPYDSTLRFIAGYKKGKITGISYNTSSFEEYQSIVKQFRLNGFVTSEKQDTAAVKADSVPVADTVRQPLSNNSSFADTASTVQDRNEPVALDTTTFFQKANMTVRITEDTRDEVKIHRITLERKENPSASSVRYADDLLAFDSHQSLIAMFGQNNVKRRMYYFTDVDTNRCSVIFPNTDRQAIFLWDDQDNFRELSLVIIGGSLRAGEDPEESSGAVSLNSWRSSTGLYTGMRISELLKINESDFNFFGTNSEFAMMAVPEKKGNLDFKQIGVVFSCLNCSGSPFLRKEKISAQAAVDERLQLYITSLIIIPGQ